MTLYDLLANATYYQYFDVYVLNAQGYHLPIGFGTRNELLNEYEHETFFDHLMDKVEIYEVSKGTLIVYINDENYDKPLEKQYDEKFVKCWKRDDPKSRPFLYTWEVREKWRL